MKTSALVISAIRIAASVAPTTVPTPPRMLTPPTTAAVMTVSSRPDGVVDWMTRSCVAKRSAAMLAKKPCSANTITTVRCGRDAAKARRLGIAAGRVDRPPAGRIAHPQRRQHGRHNHDQHRHRQDAEQFDVGEMEALRQIGDPSAAGDADQAALQDRQHAERDDDRRNAQIGDDRALRRHHRDADDERREPGQRGSARPRPRANR